MCYVSNKICFNAKNCISNEIQNILFLTVGIICKRPDQLRFLETLSDNLNTLNILKEEWHIVGDLNINLWENDMLKRENNKNIVKRY